MDGLLIDSEPLWHEAEQAVFARVNLHLTRDNCLETTGMRADEVVEYWYQRRPWNNVSKTTITKDIIDHVVWLIGKKGELKPGARQAIDFIGGLGVKTALASSSDYIVIKAVLDKFGLTPFFQVIHSAEDETMGKPHPAVYLTTCRKLSIRPEVSLAIEDSIAGVIAAKAARMQCIAVPEAHWQTDIRFALADIKLNSLLELNSDIWHRLNNS